MTPETGHYEFREGRVLYNIIGQGAPLVLVHGTPWSSFTWQGLTSELCKTHRVYSYDLIGYGQSEMRSGQTVSLDVQTDLFCELFKHWQIKNPIVVAHDFGGAITLRAHLLNGIDFRRWVMMNVVAMASWGSPFFAHVREHEAAFAGVPANIHKAIIETYIRGALEQDMDSERFDALVKPWVSQAGQAAFYRQIAQADQKYTDEVEPLYGDIRCPVKILWGENDDWISIATGRRLHAAIPHSEFKPIPDAGHLVQMDQTELVVKHVRDFLA